ncbi:HNH endonuclease signature motif containing protein [Xenorhabdus stockiae]|uniref:HNH endonuclease signature motif containing protein n=1 Tax=Xenorhabdus stockiae TaxID=351614 RepID=UPI003CE6D718
MSQFKYTDKMKDWMRVHYLLPMQELAPKFNEHFSVNYSSKSLHGFRGQLGLRTGRTGRLTKGNIPHNTRPVGTERINADGYVYVKVNKSKRWKLKHHVVWEAHHGKLPAGVVVIFKDGNQENFHIDNLLMVTRQENVILNKLYPNTPAEYKQTSAYLARILMTVNKKESARK